MNPTLFYNNNPSLKHPAWDADSHFKYLAQKKFSKFCGSKYGIGCANGTDALTIAIVRASVPLAQPIPYLLPQNFENFF